MAQRLAAEGIHVLLSGRRQSKLRELQKKIEQAGGKASVYVMDLADAPALEAGMASIMREHTQIHILINNAGFGFWSPLSTTKFSDIDEMLAVNLRAPMRICQLLLPQFKAQQGGFIINIASIAGQQGFASMTHYCASKWGLRGFSAALLEEVREFGVVVGVISPGMVNTEFFPARFSKDRAQMIQPDDVADVVWAMLSTGVNTTLSEITLRPRVPVKDH